MSKEIWKPVPEFEKLYMVSNHGRVKSLDRKTIHKNGRVHFYKSRILMAHAVTYPLVDLFENGIKRRYCVHDLVTAVFIGPKPKRYTVNHKDGNKLNNHIDNLEYATFRENSIHAIRMGLKKSWNKGMTRFQLKDCEYLLCPNKFMPKKDRNRFCSRSCASKWKASRLRIATDKDIVERCEE